MKSLTIPVWVQTSLVFLEFAFCFEGAVVRRLPAAIGYPLAFVCRFDQMDNWNSSAMRITHILNIRLQKLESRQYGKQVFDLNMNPRDNKAIKGYKHTPGRNNIFAQFEGLQFSLKINDSIGWRDQMAIHAIIYSAQCRDVGVYQCSVTGINLHKSKQEQKPILFSKLVFVDTERRVPLLSTKPDKGTFPVGQEVSVWCKIDSSAIFVGLKFYVKVGETLIPLPLTDEKIKKYPQLKTWSNVFPRVGKYRTDGSCPTLRYFSHEVKMTFKISSQAQRNTEISCLAIIQAKGSDGDSEDPHIAVSVVHRAINLASCASSPDKVCRDTRNILEYEPIMVTSTNKFLLVLLCMMIAASVFGLLVFVALLRANKDKIEQS